MFYLERPANFSPKLAGSICFIEWQGTFLLLKRSAASPQGGLWTAAPGGKVEPGETPMGAVLREIREETALELAQAQVTYISTVYYQFPDISYELHLFYSKLEKKPEVILDAEEHSDFAWKTLEQAVQMPIMRGGEECIAFVARWFKL